MTTPDAQPTDPTAEGPDEEVAARGAIPTRRLSFDASFASVPKHFAAGGNVLASHLAAALSSLFPEGEEFFVGSVRAMRDRVTDPGLKRQVAGFIGQEAVHGRQHRAFNDRLATLGYPTKRFERMTKHLLSARTRALPPRVNLATTAALEHFTATFAELLLESDEVRNLFSHDAVRDLFVWHALEELEHKAVAFDVYRVTGGTERTRIVMMHLVRLGFLVSVVTEMVVSLLGDRAAYNPRRLLRDWRTVRASPLLRGGLWRRLGDYNHRGFHPDDRDTSDLVARWRHELFGPSGALNDKRTTPAA